MCGVRAFSDAMIVDVGDLLIDFPQQILIE